MRLRELAGIDNDSSVTGFALDHRKVAPGSIFGAFQGSLFNGEDFIPAAVKRGAVAVVAREEAEVPTVPHLADPHLTLRASLAYGVSEAAAWPKQYLAAAPRGGAGD